MSGSRPAFPEARFRLDTNSSSRTSGAGALFVIRGMMQEVAADAYLIPSDSWGNITRTWEPLTGSVGDFEAKLKFHRDDLAAGRSVEVQGVTSPLIVLDVAADGAAVTPELLAQRVIGVLKNMRTPPIPTSSATGPESGRPLRARPLVAMPVLGVGAAGHGHASGAVVRALVDRLEDHLASESRFDVVLVCFRASDYAAVQQARRQRRTGGDTSSNPEVDELVDSLVTHARSRRLTVMFGAGASASLGLPLWRSLLAGLAEQAGLTEAQTASLDALDPVDAASLLCRATGSDQAFAERIAANVRLDRASLTHFLLASLEVPLAITTNYDDGYEIAIRSVAASGRTSRVAAKMPWDLPEADQAAVLKLHGDIDRGLIVLTRDDFTALHSTRRPLTAVLQEKLLSGHVLALGTTMSDPTLVRACEEVSTLLSAMPDAADPGQSRNPRGTVVFTEPQPARTALLGRHFDVVAAGGPGETLEAARRIDMLLDQVAMLASSSLEFALDPAYSDLLDGQDLELADRLRDVHENLPDPVVDSEFSQRVRTLLESLGAPRS